MVALPRARLRGLVMSPSKELQRRWELVHPSTGEVLTAQSSNEQLASFLNELTDRKHRIQEWKSTVDQEILDRMDDEASWTVLAGEYKLVGQSPAPVTKYDCEQLAEVLNDLVGKGEISSDAALRALQIETVYKPQAAGVKALLKLGGDVAKRIEGCISEVPRDRRSVRVTRSWR